MLGRLERSEAEVSILLTNDQFVQELNREYRHKDRPTDVLSFHFDNQTGNSQLEAGWLLGDIVISMDTAARQAKGRKRPLAEEVRWLLAHGLLHLCGYDHATPDEKRVMVAWTRRLVRAASAVAIPAPTGRRRRPLPRTSAHTNTPLLSATERASAARGAASTKRASAARGATSTDRASAARGAASTKRATTARGATSTKRATQPRIGAAERGRATPSTTAKTTAHVVVGRRSLKKKTKTRRSATRRATK